MNRYCSIILISAIGASCARDAAPEAAASRPSASAPAESFAQAREVVAFWRAAGPNMWFAKDDAFDKRFRERFAASYAAAQAGELSSWLDSAESALALVLLLDQYPRNSFRGTARMYESDALARRMADRAISRGHDRAIEPALRVFMYLPFGHSEDLADQDRSVDYVRTLGQPHLSHAEGHRNTVRRFGRFPHRNAILGRKTTKEEQQYLDQGGFRG
jgi:uncharacterized protein (DUF924 family)